MGIFQGRGRPVGLTIAVGLRHHKQKTSYPWYRDQERMWNRGEGGGVLAISFQKEAKYDRIIPDLFLVHLTSKAWKRRFLTGYGNFVKERPWDHFHPSNKKYLYFMTPDYLLVTKFEIFALVLLSFLQNKKMRAS